MCIFFCFSLLLSSLHLALFHQSNRAPPQWGGDATGCKLNINLLDLSDGFSLRYAAWGGSGAKSKRIWACLDLSFRNNAPYKHKMLHAKTKVTQHYRSMYKLF